MPPDRRARGRLRHALHGHALLVSEAGEKRVLVPVLHAIEEHGKILGGNISGVFGGGIGTYVLLGVGAYLVIQLIK